MVLFSVRRIGRRGSGKGETVSVKAGCSGLQGGGFQQDVSPGALALDCGFTIWLAHGWWILGRSLGGSPNGWAKCVWRPGFPFLASSESCAAEIKPTFTCTGKWM